MLRGVLTTRLTRYVLMEGGSLGSSIASASSGRVVPCSCRIGSAIGRALQEDLEACAADRLSSTTTLAVKDDTSIDCFQLWGRLGMHGAVALQTRRFDRVDGGELVSFTRSGNFVKVKEACVGHDEMRNRR